MPLDSDERHRQTLSLNGERICFKWRNPFHESPQVEKRTSLLNSDETNERRVLIGSSKLVLPKQKTTKKLKLTFKKTQRVKLL
jgi:hypothetical protein